MTRELFLDRLMMAESDGRDTAANPKSSALGAFQFIEDTFIYLVERHFAEEVSGKSRTDILALRTDRDFARKVANAYIEENASYLRERGAEPSFPHLRLTFLLGPSGAARVIAAAPGTPVAHLLSEEALNANRFLRAMTAADLIVRAAWDISAERAAGKRPPAAGNGIAVKCNLKLPSCKRWLMLEQRKLAAGNGKGKRKRALAKP